MNPGHVTSWTPVEQWVFAEMTRAALVASLDDGPSVRAAPFDDDTARFRAEIHASDLETTLALAFDADLVTVSLDPVCIDENTWRDGWAVLLQRDPGDGEREVRVLSLESPSAVLTHARRSAWTAHLRVQSRAVTQALDGVDETVALTDLAFHRYTYQSTSATRVGPLAWSAPTLAEVAPWWQIDLGPSRCVASLKVHLARVPMGAKVTVTAFAYPMPDGAPPAGCFTREFQADATRRCPNGDVRLAIDDSVVTRHVRVTLSMPDRSPVALSVTALEALGADLFDSTLSRTLRRAFTLHHERTLFVARDGSGGYVRQLTYGEVWTRAMALARALALRVEPAVRPDGRVFLGVMTRNRPEWIMADLAALARGYVLVPIAPDDPDERLGQILSLARPDVVVCEPDNLRRVVALGTALGLRLAVLCDADATEAGCAGFEALVREGREAQPPPAVSRPEDAIYSVLFTSGSTGTPKGAMRSYATFHAMLASYGAGHENHHLSFQPLSHLSERMSLPWLVIHGGTIGFSRGGAFLLDELRAFAPTQVASVPRLFDLLHSNYQRRLRAAVAAEPEVRRATHEARCLAEARGAFGARVVAVAVGSAPVSPEVLAFMHRAFADLWVSEGYGSTEVGTIATDGVISPSVEVKLVSDDTPAPGEAQRGEIRVRSPHMISGYLGGEIADKNVSDSEGFFATGDLGERGPDGVIRVVGRLRSTVKLAQGEFVSAETVESALATAPVVDRVFVHAQPGALGVAAMVLPARDVLAGLLDAPADSPLDALTALPGAPDAVLSALRSHGRSAGLAAWELPRAVLLDPAALTVHNGLLTPSGKLARGALTARYATRLASLAAGIVPDQGSSPNHVSEGDFAQRAVAVASRILGRAVDPREPLAAVGVDSFAAAEILASLGEALGREVPLALWFECACLEDLAARLTRFARAPHAPAHDALADEDLGRSVALDPDAAAPSLPLRAVLLTGATGFLGAHLVEALVALTDLHIVCLVRAPDDRAAEVRLATALDGYDIPAPPVGRVRALAGDLAAPGLGLSEARLRGLSEGVDAVLHAGATVSWLSPYAALRAANVHGTLALLELAGSARKRPMHFVSTISTAPPDSDERSTLTRAEISRGSPYGLSKWVAEALVRRAGDDGLPVAIYRPAMISAHSERGHGNPEDFLHRYLLGASDLGLYLDLPDARIDMTPVDFVAKAVVSLLVARPLGGDTYHLANVEQSLTYARLGEAMARAGINVRPAPYAVFREALRGARGARLHALAAYFPEGDFGLAMGPWPCARTVAALADLGVARPAIDDALIARTVSSLRRRGLLKPLP